MAVIEIDYLLQDAIMERPYPFCIGEDMFYIYPQTLGKMLLNQRIIEQMGIKREFLNTNITKEIIRITKQHRDYCCDLIAYMTARNDYYDVFNLPAFNKRKETFMEQPDEDIASILTLLMTADKTSQFIKHLGIDVEQKNMQKVMNVKHKNDKNSYNFGGVSIYGSLIDVAMERWKMTKRQVVWELDYTSLRLLLADKINSIYVTDQERKKIHITNDRTKISGDNKEAMWKVIQSESWD